MFELGLHEPGIYAEYAIPVRYKKIVLDCGYRADLLFSDDILVENKTVDAIPAVQRVRLLTWEPAR